MFDEHRIVIVIVCFIADIQKNGNNSIRKAKMKNIHLDLHCCRSSSNVYKETTESICFNNKNRSACHTDEWKQLRMCWVLRKIHFH